MGESTIVLARGSGRIGDRSVVGVRGDMGERAILLARGSGRIGDRSVVGVRGDMDEGGVLLALGRGRIGDRLVVGVSGDAGDGGMILLSRRVGWIGERLVVGVRGDAGDGGNLLARGRGPIGDWSVVGVSGDIGDRGALLAVGRGRIGDRLVVGVSGDFMADGGPGLLALGMGSGRIGDRQGSNADRQLVRGLPFPLLIVTHRMSTATQGIKNNYYKSIPIIIIKIINQPNARQEQRTLMVSRRRLAMARCHARLNGCGSSSGHVDRVMCEFFTKKKKRKEAWSFF